MSSSHDYKIAAEPDMSGEANRHIWYYFIGFAMMLFITMAGLIIMYRFQVQYEKEKKIGNVMKRETLDQMALSRSYLSGKRGMFEGKKNVPIDDAMAKFLKEARDRR